MFSTKLSKKDATELILKVSNDYWRALSKDLPAHKEKGSEMEYLTRAFHEVTGIDHVAQKLSEHLGDANIQLPSAALVGNIKEMLN